MLFFKNGRGSRLTRSQYQSVADAVERCVKDLGAIDFVM